MIPSRVLLRDGTRIALTTWAGTAPRIVALHGLGQLGAAWSAFASAVDRRAEVVAIDLRGHGDSDDDPSGGYLLATFVRDVVELLESTSPEPPVLIGHSLGGRIALEIAARDLTPIAAAVVVDASPTPPAATLAHLEEHFAAAPLRATSASSYADRLATLHPLASPEALRPLIDALRTLPDGSVEERVDPRSRCARGAPGCSESRGRRSGAAQRRSPSCGASRRRC